MKAIILGGTSGIGRSIANKLKKSCKKTIVAGSKDIDTLSLKSVNKFIIKNKHPDILILNTGGPPDIKFIKIKDEVWIENFKKLFLSFA